jgi:hypothetical protein
LTISATKNEIGIACRWKEFYCLSVDGSSQDGLNLDAGSEHQIEIVVEEEGTQLRRQEQQERQTDSLP